MERKIRFAPGEYYHVYNRGVEKRKVFLSKDDYQRFLELLFLCNKKDSVVFRLIPKSEKFLDKGHARLVSIGAYALMPNHFHLLVRINDNEHGLTEFLRKVTTAYTMYFNKKNQRVGPLFQGVFKAEHVEDDLYLKYLYSYTHLNPASIIDPEWKEHLKKGNERKILDFVKTYSYSSYDDYLNNKRAQKVILSKSDFPDYFESHFDLEKSLSDWIVAE